MKSILLLISFISVFFVSDLPSVRKAYRTAKSSKQETFTLHKKLTKIVLKDNKTLVAYKGAVSILTSRYVKGKKLKTAAIKHGVFLLEHAVKKQPKNIEIRFIRLTVQQNIPKFIKYNSNIEEDKGFILANFYSISTTELKEAITEYFLESKYFTEEEKSVISQF